MPLKLRQSVGVLMKDVDVEDGGIKDAVIHIDVFMADVESLGGGIMTMTIMIN